LSVDNDGHYALSVEAKFVYQFVTITISVLFWFVASYCSAGTIREPVMAGKFYPADSAELAKVVSAHLANVVNEPAIDGQILAILVPHAGLIYSGPTAAYAFKLLANSTFRKVVMCGPSHQYGFRGVSVYGPDVTWKTPLGTVSCNDALCNVLLKNDKAAGIIPEAHAKEHCLEVELPYLQSTLHNFQIVPVIMGNQDEETIDGLAKALETLPDDGTTLMLASSDWQHYRPAEVGYPMDSLGMACLEQLDFNRLEKYLGSGKVEMCGGGPAVAVFKAAKAKGADRVKILHYADSGDMTGDKSAVVGYVAAVIYKASSDTKKVGAVNESSGYRLTSGEKTELLKIARKSIESYLSSGNTPEFTVSQKLREPGAAFVTLTKSGDLRGCIGSTSAVKPLFQTVSECAIQAAIADPRFPAVTSDELPAIDLEISVLTPLQKVNSLDEIVVGRDGLMITLGRNRGLLLPQVATDYKWDRTQFLENTCLKAGLPRDAYNRPDAFIQKFQALVFGEKESDEKSDSR
jgi:AmmeMemoRadiSam system protein B/AmmeMemoRadiSam system protein A